MEKINPAMVEHLRVMARQGHTPSQILRELIRRLAAEKPHKVTLVQYMREAFCLTLRQASPIGGWADDGSAELSDDKIDHFILPEIEQNRSRWNCAHTVVH